ncbi:NAD-binding Rossmann fold oxidoreductase family protein [Aspergillus ellipticus CBS 707.79]|uniref:NAD-binding Rossmann fold oxidoreductase family protein n=1 Tax=Aspergillus ellipticus CBS 707.79 TaxID=1448320 RepID=A0A319EEX4_9EURO|nr:NAD-binding Rossmann fold oxidoreductase family protein [Aspergillus ellipticus CBS 707.79]
MTGSASRVEVALLGGGIWAREEHAPAIEAAQNYLSFKAVYSRSAASAHSIAENISSPVDIYSEDTENRFDDLLQRSDIQAVVVSLPIGHQSRFIKSALLAGKHVLSEKPVAENIEEAKALINWYRTEINGPTWTVAENWRFLKSYEYAAKELKNLGKIIGFQGRQHDVVPENWKFNLTEWRRNPIHQGGYLLDGGVHYVAGLRLLLGEEPGNQIASLAAFTNQIQPYLPPVDTADVILRTRAGVTGVFQISRGTSLRADEWTIACSNGWIKIENETVTISRNGEIEVVTIPNERTGVPPEIRAWGQGLVEGKTRSEQEPEAALADLELIELMLKSGSQGGIPLECSHQDVLN